MLDKEKIKNKIDKSGLSQGYLADKLEISRNCFNYKINGGKDFKASEIVKLRELLKISAKDTIDIFLRN